MELAECLIALNPRTDQIEVGYLLTESAPDWTTPYRMTGGEAYANVREMKGVDARHYIMSEFLGIVIRDKVPMDATHREFLKIDEYRQAVPTDVEGADQG